MLYPLILLALATAVLLSLTADFCSRLLKELRKQGGPRSVLGLRQQGLGYAVFWAFFAGIWLLHADDAAAVVLLVAAQ